MRCGVKSCLNPRGTAWDEAAAREIAGSAWNLDASPASAYFQGLAPGLGPAAPEWRNWQTRQVEGLVRVIPRAGSNPVSGNQRR